MLIGSLSKYFALLSRSMIQITALNTVWFQKHGHYSSEGEITTRLNVDCVQREMLKNQNIHRSFYSVFQWKITISDEHRSTNLNMKPQSWGIF